MVDHLLIMMVILMTLKVTFQVDMVANQVTKQKMLVAQIPNQRSTRLEVMVVLLQMTVMMQIVKRKKALRAKIKREGLKEAMDPVLVVVPVVPVAMMNVTV